MYSVYSYELNGNGPWSLLYSPDNVDKGYIFTSASFAVEIDKAGEASFTIPFNHPEYDNIHKLSTMIVIKNDNKIVWFGRVYGIKRDFYNNKQITCEGALTFLGDICLMPFRYYEEDKIQTGDTKTYHIKPVCKSDHLAYIMELYNTRCSKKRCVQVTPFSEIVASEANISGCDSFNTVLQEIQDKVIEDYDYSILTTYNLTDDGWVKPFFEIGRLPFSTCSQTIEFGKNLIDFEECLSADELYSSIIPVGSGNISIFNDNNADDADSKLPLIDRNYFITTGLESSCGVIDKVVNFDGIEDRNVLRATGEKILELGGGVTESTFTINAVDLHLLDVNTDEIVAGASVKVISKPHKLDRFFVCLKTEIDMLSPDKNKYTFSAASKSASEKLTGKVQNDSDKNRKELSKKVSMNQDYGVISIEPDNVSLVLKMQKEAK